MKLKMKSCLVTVLAMGLWGCGIEIPEDAKFVSGQEDLAGEGEDAEYFLGDDVEYASATNGQSEYDEDDQAIIQLVKDLHKASRIQVAACMGITEEVSAFEAKKEELIASGMSREDVKAELNADHEELRSLVDKETSKECRQSVRETELGQTTKNLIESCWEKPERKPKRNFAFSLRMNKRKGFKGRGKRGHKVPPKQFATFDTQECADAQAVADEYLNQ